jgi:HK97 family phage portal protein
LSILRSIDNAIRRAVLNLAVSSEKAWNPGLWNVRSSASGEDVNEYTALTYSAVFNAVSLISGTLASLPLHLMQRRDKTKRYATEHPLYRVLHSVGNPYMTSMAVRECLISHILAWGNGYAEKQRNGYGDIVALWPITPNRVRVRMQDGELVYQITVGGENLTMTRENILHIPGLGFDGFTGYSIVQMAAKSISLGMSMETFGERYFGAGTHPGVIVTHPGKLGEETHKNLKNSLTDTYSGLGQSHRLMLLEEGMTFQSIGVPPNDSQFLESRQFHITEIARWFNLPPHKLKDLTKSSFNNIEQEQLSYVIDALLPWAVRLEQNLNMQLLREVDQKAGLYFKHVFEGLLRGSSKDRAEFYRAMVGIGAMSINEVREKEDYDPVDGGDVHLIPLNMTTLENAGKINQGEPNETEEPISPEGEDEAEDRSQNRRGNLIPLR